jgi:thiol-disulfide isomerase/thioredoxin
MNPVPALLIIVALVLAATALGVLWRARTGRVRTAPATTDTDVVTAEVLGIGEPLGRDATIVQFSTEYCGPCRTAERVLTAVAGERTHVAYVDVDLGEHPSLADRFGVLQTPTVLLLDAAGRIRARIGGVPRVDAVRDRLDEIVKESHEPVG